MFCLGPSLNLGTDERLQLDGEGAPLIMIFFREIAET
jgi:hypothetical protein